MPDTAALAGATPIVLAYSGGLDTSFLVPWLAERHRRPVITVTVDTGGIDAAGARALAARSRALGAVEHTQVDARADYFEQVLRFLIMGNVRRGQLYPLGVGAERVMQAQTIARLARQLGSDTVAHGCTAAGNDQVRFEVALRTLAPDLRVLAPVRDEAFKRQDELEYLRQRALPVPPTAARYSVNRGLWGVTIGGRETLTSAGSIPDDAWLLTRDAFTRPRPAERHVLGFRAGRPVALDGRAGSPVEIIEALEALAAPFGIGRGIHLGDTIIGTKGRVAFEAPAAGRRRSPRSASHARRHAQRGGRQAGLRHPGLRPVARGAHRRRYSRRGRRRHRGRGPQQQVDLQHPRADQRPHGQARQGRRGRGCARPSPG